MKTEMMWNERGGGPVTNPVFDTVEINKAHILSFFTGDDGNAAGIEGFVNEVDRFAAMKNTSGQTIFPTKEAVILQLYGLPTFLWRYDDINKYIKQLGFDLSKVEEFRCEPFGAGSTALYKFLLVRDGMALYNEYKSKKVIQ